MKKLLSIIFIVLFLSANVFAAVITFDDIPGGSIQNDHGPMPDGYAGFDWDCTIGYLSWYDAVQPFNYRGAISGDFVLFNNWGGSAIITNSEGQDFYYNGLYARSWYTGVILNGIVKGYNNGVLVFSDKLLLTETWQEYTGTDNSSIPIDKLVFDFGNFFLVDNLDIPHTNPNPVPIPGTFILLSSGLMGFFIMSRKRRNE